MTIVSANDGYSAQQRDGTVREAIPVFDAGLSSVGTGATHLAKAEDAPHTSSDVGIAVWGVQNTAQVAITSTDLDYSPLAVDDKGNTVISGTLGALGSTAADGGTLVNAMKTQSINKIYNGTTEDLSRSIVNSTNSTGTGITAVGLVAQFDDVSPSTVTENQFGNVRMTANRSLMVSIPVTTISTSITRPSDTNAYAANDAFANSTSAPTSGGFTLTGAAPVSGGNGVITDAVFSMSASSAFQGELWIFDQSVTATNDNATLSVSDSDILNLVGVIPFNTVDTNSANAISYVTGLNIGFTCIGTANLRFVVKVISAFTPASAEVLSVRLKVQN